MLIGYETWFQFTTQKQIYAQDKSSRFLGDVFFKTVLTQKKPSH